ncbi:MAG: FAD-binding protein [Promethearchaeota archaeon]
MDVFNIDSDLFEIIRLNTVIIGSGAAGLNCALHLIDEGIAPKDVSIITEKLGGGTSFNTGSDKQTYYKLSIIGDQNDSPIEMAKDLFAGGAMHGDIALVEATNSLREFFHLIQLGVPFPHDQFGGYVGYKTDNDPKQRATSIGPLTSQKMSKCLLKAVQHQGIKIYDKHFVFQIITDSFNGIQRATGLLAFQVDKLTTEKNIEEIMNSIRVFKVENIIIATGGPAILYGDSVYPHSQKGTLGLAIHAGCKLQNLTESQFGLASINFRWNVSGSYQQVIPRYISLDDKNNEVEFLNCYFPSFLELSKAVFLKGYQWPFNSEHIENYGSSLIDLAVYYERQYLGRKVFLDFTKNPINYDINNFYTIAKQYLKKSNAIRKTPIERLRQLNAQAIQLYEDHGINLEKTPLEIAVCNQHLNGGVSSDIWWETNIKHLFAIGEINGSHGIHRPGGAALNSGQVGGLRVAQKIANHYKNLIPNDNQQFNDKLRGVIMFLFKEIETALEEKKDSITSKEILTQIHNRMDRFASIIRPADGLAHAIHEGMNQYLNLLKSINLNENKEIIEYFRVKDALINEYYILKSILEYHLAKGSSRGSYLAIRGDLNEDINEKYVVPHKNLKQYQFIKSDNIFTNKIQTIQPKEGGTLIFSLDIRFEDVRKIPNEIGWFETVWKDYSDKKIFD